MTNDRNVSSYLLDKYADDSLSGSDSPEPKTNEQPERNLLAAILQCAIWDVDTPSRGHRQPAIAYINSSSRDEFSFIWICNELDLNPDLVREAILMRI